MVDALTEAMELAYKVPLMTPAFTEPIELA